jgi:dTMP kinase
MASMSDVGRARRGVFLVFEGIDGSGTTTQASLYADELRRRGRRVHVTREPSVGPVGSLIRLALTHRVPLPEARRAQQMALLFAADRLDHVAHEIEPHLDVGDVVISDRYDLSSLAYQSTSAAEAPPTSAALDMVSWIRELNRYARRPDATVVLDVSPEVAAARRTARGGPRELFDDADLQRRLAAAYLRAEDLIPGDRVIHIDGDRDAASVTAAIAAAVTPLVGV